MRRRNIFCPTHSTGCREHRASVAMSNREAKKPRSRESKEQDAERLAGFTSCARTFQRLSVTPPCPPWDAIFLFGTALRRQVTHRR
jgi:hypothetical protein